MGIVLPRDGVDRPRALAVEVAPREIVGRRIVGAHAPHDFARRLFDDRDEIALAGIDHHVVRVEPGVPAVVPPVRPQGLHVVDDEEIGPRPDLGLREQDRPALFVDAELVEMTVGDPLPHDVAAGSDLVDRLVRELGVVKLRDRVFLLADHHRVAVGETAEIVILPRLAAGRAIAPLPDDVAVPVHFDNGFVEEGIGLPLEQDMALPAPVDGGVDHLGRKPGMGPGIDRVPRDIDQVGLAVAALIHDMAVVDPGFMVDRYALGKDGRRHGDSFGFRPNRRTGGDRSGWNVSAWTISSPSRRRGSAEAGGQLGGRVVSGDGGRHVGATMRPPGRAAGDHARAVWIRARRAFYFLFSMR